MDFEILILVILTLVVTRCQPLSIVIVAIVVYMVLLNNNTTFTNEKKNKPSYAISAAAARNLEKTENPKFKKIQSAEMSTNQSANTPSLPSREDAKTMQTSEIIRPTSTINSEDYTLQGMEKKYNGHTFKRDLSYRQTTDERTRYVNSLYKDFIKENAKKDPNMRAIGDAGCATIRGTRESAHMIDC